MNYTNEVESIRMLGMAFDKDMNEIYPHPELASLYEELPTYFSIGEKEEYGEYVRESDFSLRNELLAAMQEQVCSSVVLMRVHDNIFSMKSIVEGARRAWVRTRDEKLRQKYERLMYIYHELCEKG